jgi:hypothetical protein
MKKIALLIAMAVLSFQAFPQSQEAQQLLLNWEKLTQLKKILNDMYAGHKIVYKGYTTIKDISEGNFNLHKDFLDGLLEVSPAVRKYKRVADIMNFQIKIAREYKTAYNQFRQDKNFAPEEIDYLGKVYGNLFNQSLKSLDELTMIITAGSLRMSDDERLQAIDRIYSEVVLQFSFLQEFNNSTAVLSVQREKDAQEIEVSRKLHGIK